MRTTALVGIFLVFVASVVEAQLLGGTIYWRNVGTRRIEFTILTAWPSTSVGSVTLEYGDSTSDPGLLAKDTVIYTGTIATGGTYVVTSRTVTKQYSTNGVFDARFRNVNRPNGLQSGSAAPITVTAKVDVSESGSPRVIALPIVQLEKSASATQQLALADPDGLGNGLTCRLATLAESGINAPTIGGQTIQITSDCRIVWNTLGGNDNELYPVQVVAQRGANHFVQSTFLVRIVDRVAKKPQCVSSIPRYNTKICDTASATFTVNDADSANLEYSVLIPLPGTITPSTPATTPVAGTWTYVPVVNDVELVVASLIVFRDANNLTAFCPVVQRFDDITCDDLFLSESVNCKTRATPKIITINVDADAASEFTTDCPGATITTISAQSINLTIPPNRDGACSLSATLIDTCYGQRVCDRTIDQRCCQIGFDVCGICGGDGKSCLDCRGQPDPSGTGPKVDECGICGGDNTACCNNYLGINNTLWNYLLIPEVVSDLIERLETTYSVLEWIDQNLPEPEGLPQVVDCDLIGTLAEINKMFIFDCGLETFCKSSGQFLTSLQYATNNFII